MPSTSIFLEVIVAPSFSDDARELLAKKKNLRLIAAPAPSNDLEFRSAAGGILEQSVDRIGARDAWRSSPSVSQPRRWTASNSPGSSART